MFLLQLETHPVVEAISAPEACQIDCNLLRPLIRILLLLVPYGYVIMKKNKNS